MKNLRWLVLLTLTLTACNAAPRSPKAYVGLFGDNAVAVIDTGTLTVVKTIPVPTGPHGLVASPDGTRVYVSSDGASTVSVIDAVADAVVASIEVGTTPHGLTMSPDGRRLLVSGFGSNQLLVVDTATNAVSGRVSIARPHNSAISTDGRTAFVGSQQPGSPALVVVDLPSLAVRETIPLAQSPRALDASGSLVYYTLAGVDALALLDAGSDQTAGQVRTGGSPHHMRAVPGTMVEMVVSQTANDLEFIDPVARAVVSTVPVGRSPHWIAARADGSTAYVTDEASNEVSVVDLRSRVLTATIPVGNAPRKIAVQPGPSRIMD